MFNNRISEKKFKKARVNLGDLCFFFTEHKNDLNSVLNSRNINKLSFNYCLVFDYFLYHHLKKLFTEEELNCENFYLFSQSFIPKTHQDVVLIKDYDNLYAQISCDYLKAIWNVFILKDSNVNLVNFINQQRLELVELHERFKNLNNIQEPFVVQEFEFLLEKLNTHLFILMDLVFTRYCLLSAVSQKGFDYSKFRPSVLFFVFLFDRYLITYLLNILLYINIYQLASERYLQSKQ